VTTPWSSLFFTRLRGRAAPAFVVGSAIQPAAATWAVARTWVKALRAAGLQPGDRVVLALPAGGAFVSVLVAALCEGWTLAVVPPADDAEQWLDILDARLAIAEGATGPGRARPAAGGACPERVTLRPATGAPTHDARLLLRTSGTTSAGRWIALSDANVAAVLDSHRPALGLSGAIVLSVLPWHHVFGLVLDLLPALLDAEEIVRDPAGGRDVAALSALAAEVPVTHLNLVPATAMALAARDDGLLDRLQGGLVGGAAVSASLAERLARTRLRVGYGQTEASPGITLGAPGEWSARWLGRAVGCEVRRDDDGVLAFRGANAAIGEWRDGTLHRAEAGAWRRTGDLVEAVGDGWRFEGRIGDGFKLANGRMVETARWEAALRAALPSADDVLLWTPDGERLAVSVTVTSATDELAGTVRAALGPLGERLAAVHVVPRESWRRTPKGEVDRRHPPTA
jgi:acyl-CoA synthetase (AMP-forming)/AMP-acid ligase II